MKNIFSVLRFLLVGGAATAIHLVVAFILFAAFSDINVYLVNVIAFLVAFLFSYFGHRFFTFRKYGSFYLFLMVALSGFFINNLMLFVLSAVGVFDFVALCFSTLSAAIFTYFLSRFFVFK